MPETAIAINRDELQEELDEGCVGGVADNDSMHNSDDQASPSFSSRNKELGAKGEQAARVFLERRGLEIVETNWCCFAGEADIIAIDGETLCFIEVKTRTGTRKGFPAEAVDAKKRAKYEKIAACYLQDNRLFDMRIRFDIVSIIVLSDSNAFLRYHINAFGAG